MTAPNSDCAIDLNAVALDRSSQPAGQLRSDAMYLLIAVIVSLRADDIGAGVGDSGEKMEQTHCFPFSHRPIVICIVCQ